MKFSRKTYGEQPFTTKEELVERVSRLANVANKRAKRLVTAANKGRVNLNNSAYRVYEKAVEKAQQYIGLRQSFVTTGKKVLSKINLNQLSSLEGRLLHFLGSESSTVPGIRKMVSERKETLNRKYGVELGDLSADEETKLWDTLHRIEASRNTELSSEQILQILDAERKVERSEDISDTIKSLLESYPAEDIRAMIPRLYKAQGKALHTVRESPKVKSLKSGDGYRRFKRQEVDI